MIDPDWQNPEGVPLSAILFGGRRPQHDSAGERSVRLGTRRVHGFGLRLGNHRRRARHRPACCAAIRSPCCRSAATTWAITSRTGCRSPSAPTAAKLPKIYFVNWFRKDANGKWLWPGYGDNSRVLKWICERVEGTAKAQQTPIGNLPTPDALDLSGLNLSGRNIQALLSVDTAGWKKEVRTSRRTTPNSAAICPRRSAHNSTGCAGVWADSAVAPAPCAYEPGHRAAPPESRRSRREEARFPPTKESKPPHVGSYKQGWCRAER